MIEVIDHLIIAVKNLEIAENNFIKLLGFNPVWQGSHEDLGTSNSIFLLRNTYLELLTADGEGAGAELVKNFLKKHGEGLIGIAYGAKDLYSTRANLSSKGFSLPSITKGVGHCNETGSQRKWITQLLPFELTRGIFTFLIEHKEGVLPQSKECSPSVVNRLDHVVIKTSDVDAVIKVYRDAFGIRLALDKFVEHWKRRMLFFRLNKTTIEVIESSDQEKSMDYLWGIALEVESLSDAHDRLSGIGVELSSIKPGLKENTVVCTVKSHNHNIPMLLIEYLNA